MGTTTINKVSTKIIAPQVAHIRPKIFLIIAVLKAESKK